MTTFVDFTNFIKSTLNGHFSTTNLWKISTHFKTLTHIVMLVVAVEHKYLHVFDFYKSTSSRCPSKHYLYRNYTWRTTQMDFYEITWTRLVCTNQCYSQESVVVIERTRNCNKSNKNQLTTVFDDSFTAELHDNNTGHKNVAIQEILECFNDNYDDFN